jgi:hypothetical protein
MMTPAERLVKRQKEIEDIFALYGAQAVRIWGVPETDRGVQPDVDVLLSFDEADLAPILICFRKHFFADREKTRWMKLDQDGFFLSNVMTLLLGFLVNVCDERAVKNFHPVTYSKTLATHHWE